MNKTAKRKLIQEVKAFQDLTLVELTTSWLISNWYKFSDEQKIKVALVIAPKGISEKVEHSGSIEGTKISITAISVTPKNEDSRLSDNATPNGSAAISH